MKGMKTPLTVMFALLVAAFVLGPSLITPLSSEASRSTATNEANWREITPATPTQSADDSQIPARPVGSNPDQPAGNLNLNVARAGHTSTALGNGRVAIIGGQNQKGPVREIEVLDPDAGSIKTAGALRIPRSTVRLASEKV
jgi:hypothetical protein